MGIAGLVLGILGAIGAWVPGLVYISWALALVGIIISAKAMKAAKAVNEPTGVAVAGLVLSIVGLVIALPRLICAVMCASALGAAGRGIGSW